MVENKILDKSKDGSETDIYEKVKKTVNLLINTDIDYLYKKQREHITKDESSQAFGVDILSDTFNEYKDSDVLGIDLPLWIDWNDEKKEKLMIVGRDPQRNINNIKNDEDKRLIIGSPYSLASNGGRVAKNNYWSFIEPLTENQRLYITDIYKLFIINSPEKVKKLRGLPIHYELFKKELEFVQPDLIITIGKDAEIAVREIFTIPLASEKNDIEPFYEGSVKFPYEGSTKNIKCYFIPHISGRVTDFIPTISKLYLSIGKLRKDTAKDNSIEIIGEELKFYREKLFNRK